MWRLYAELFVLVVVAFTIGAAVAALVLRVVVREKAAGSATPDAAGPTGTPGGAA